MRIAIQGEPGSFSEEAALGLFPQARAVACASFPEVYRLLHAKQVERALIPIENTLAGSVAENYDLLREQPVYILAETQLRIRHNLIVAPGTKLGAIRRVLSHPVALQQCRLLLARHPQWEVVPFYDTAGSVKHLMEARLGDAAAIASARAAAVYGARILKREVEDNKQNFTRFFLLGRTPKWSSKANKISLVFRTRDLPGALFRCLSVFALRDMSLSRIESRPVPGRPWEYSFYMDLLADPRALATRNALRHLAEITEFVKILGAYPARQAHLKR